MYTAAVAVTTTSIVMVHIFQGFVSAQRDTICYSKGYVQLLYSNWNIAIEHTLWGSIWEGYIAILQGLAVLHCTMYWSTAAVLQYIV